MGGIEVVATRDYSVGVRTLANGEKEQMQTEKVNALYYELAGGGFVCIRPSGTEPKLKVYYSIKAQDKTQADKLFEQVKQNFEQLM